MTADCTSHESGDPGNASGSSRRGFLTSAIGLVGAVAGPGAATDVAAEDRSQGAVQVNPRIFTFVGGQAGMWRVESVRGIAGDSLPAVDRLDIVAGAVGVLPDRAEWMLRGVTSNDRYVTRSEKDHLVKTQAPLGRPESTHAALIPIRKSAKWWALTQDERRAIFEERSRHNSIGLKYLPAVARRLHHCRDLGESEPFDFLTLFDYAKGDAGAFDDLVAALRATEEWTFVEREVDIRLVRAS